MFTEPLADFFDTANGFAEDAVWSVGPATVQVVFDNEFQFAAIGAAGKESQNPQVTVRTSQVPTVAQGQTLTIRGVVYKITSVEPDGQGIAVLGLRKATL